MSIKVLPATDDWIFKLLFGDERNKSVLIDLLKALVDLPDEECELSKVPLASDGTDGWEWVQFLLARTEEEIEMLAQRNPEIRKAANALYELSADPEVRAEYEARLKAWRDRAAQIDGAREDERDVWRAVVADKDAELASKDAENERLRSENAGKDTEIERLLAQVAELKAKTPS